MTIFRNSAYSVLGLAGPLVVTALILPSLINLIGLERFGALALAWLLFGYFGQADFGIGRALTQRVSALGAHEGPLRARAVASALALGTAVGLMGGAAIYLAGSWYFSDHFEASSGTLDEIDGSLWLLALAGPLVTLSGIASGSLIGVGRFKRVSLSNFLGGSAMQLMPFIAAMIWSPKLPILILASIAARSVGLAVLLPGVHAAFFRDNPFRFHRPEALRLLGFGKWVMLTALIGPLMVLLDRFAIGAVLGATLVAVYTIPFQIGSKVMVLPHAVMQVLFPHFAARENLEKSDACAKFSRNTALLFAPIVLLFIAFAEPLLRAWLGEVFDPRSAMVTRIVFIGFWFNAIAAVPFTKLQASGNPRFTGLLHLGELPFYIILLFVLGQSLGLVGIALAFALRCAGDGAIMLLRTRSLKPDVLISLVSLAAILTGVAFAAPEGWYSAGIVFASAAIAVLVVAISQWPGEVALARNASVRYLRAKLA